MVTGAALTLRVFPVVWMFNDRHSVLSWPPQLWRLVTNFTVLDRFSLNFLFQQIWLIKYGASYEQGKFLGNAADAIYMLLVGMATTAAVDLAVPTLFGAFWHGPTLVFMLIYLWSKQNATTPVSFFGVITFNGTYLPFALLALDVVQGASPSTGVTGILVGHVYYFLTEVYPRASGRFLLATPEWLARAVAARRLGRPGPRVTVTGAAPAAAHPTDTRFRAFSGSGRRLAD